MRIDQIPAIVEYGSRLGDWEADTIIGKAHKQAMLTLVDRKSSYLLMKKVMHKTTELVSESIIQLLSDMPVQTITTDNGKELAYHQKIAPKLNSDIYFSDPYSSWQRGTNENTNGLIRQYFPKSKDVREINPKEVKLVMERLNNRPRKRLSYKIPGEVLFGR